MDNFGDVLGSLGDVIGELFSGEGGAEGGLGFAAFLAPEGRRRRGEGSPVPSAYERYLCGGPRELNINDR